MSNSKQPGWGGGGGGGATPVDLGQFFEKTHFDGIQYVKIIPIKNGLYLQYTCIEGVYQSC